MKKKVLPVAANFSLNKKAKNKKRGAFFWGTSFLGENIWQIFHWNSVFLKNIFTNHTKQYIMQ